MTLTELRYIVALAKTRHFSRAAAECHVSQPTLSVAIKKLERTLGVTLFERHHNEIRITEIGRKMVAQAQRVLEEAEKIELLAKSDACHLSTPLKIGCIYTVAPYLLPKLIPALKKKAPDMPLIIEENFTANLRVKLQQGELDAIVIALPFNEPSVVVKPLYEESFSVLMPKTHPLANKESIGGRDLSKENVLLLGEGHCFRDHVLNACPGCKPNELQQTIEGSSLETLRHMVASGMGVTVLPDSATQVRHYSNSLCVKPFSGKAPQRTVALAWRASFPRTKAIDALIKAAAAI